MDPAAAISNVVVWLIKAVLRDWASLKDWAEHAELDLQKEIYKQKELGNLNKEITKILPNLKSKSRNDYLRRIKDVAYSVQDIVDELAYQRIQGEVERIDTKITSPCNGELISSPSNEDPSEVNKPGSKLRPSSGHRRSGNMLSSLFKRSNSKKGGDNSPNDLVRRIDELVISLQSAHDDIVQALTSEASDANSVSNREIQPQMSIQTINSPFGEPQVFGRDQERDYLVLKLLTDKSKGVPSVFTIVGSPGVGKTTLAQLVYTDPRVKSCFEVQMWVIADSDFNASRVVHEYDDRYVETKTSELRKKIGDCLRSKRILLVVDAMQEGCKSEWESLLDDLKQSTSSVEGSVILVTTRAESVAKIVSPSDPVHLYGLGDRDFWDLFKSFTFDDDWFDRNRNLEIICRQIARKLNGNPLLAKTVSALLNRDINKTHWRGVLDSLNAVGEDVINRVLKLSYDNLPFNLQQCFSYCTLFHKDYPLDREDMIRLWIAQGLVVVSKERRMEDFGCEYFDSLVDHGFLQRVNPISRLSSKYHTHDLMHDLVSSSSNEFVNISIVRKDFDKELDEHTKSVKPDNLRTFIFLGKNYSDLENVPSHIKNAKVLRVLGLNDTRSFSPFLANISNFIHLRYLHLNSDFVTLPTDICKLYHLQVLDVSNCRKLTSLPENFNNLIQLRHFIADNGLHSMIFNVGKLISLQELSEFRVKTESGFDIKQLGDLMGLGGSLSIFNLFHIRSQEEASKARLHEKEFLSSLCLSWDGNDAEKEEEEKVFEGLEPHKNLESLQILGYAGNNMPSWFMNLLKIESVYLQNCSGLKSLPPLVKLPFLKKLHLKSLPEVKEMGPELYGSSQDGASFQSLEEILIEDMAGLEIWHWVLRKEALLFPVLQVLEIKNCPNLRQVPLSTPDSVITEGNKRFPSLKTLVIHNCPKVEKIPPLPHTHRISRISIKGVGSFGELNLSVLRDQLLLEISSNRDMESLDELLVFYNLRSLNSLRIKQCTNLKSLACERIFSLVCLKILSIEECNELDSLPSDLSRLPSLEKLSIIGCKSVKSFPESGLPDSLKELHVDKCSVELSEICERIRCKGKITVKLEGESI